MTPRLTTLADAEPVLALEVPLQTLPERVRRLVMLAQWVAEQHLPPPGPPRALRVRFRVPYLKSTAEAYAGITERAAVTLTTGKAWAGLYDPSAPNEAWVDVGRDPTEVARLVLHELAHAWRWGTPQGKGMSAEEHEEEAWDWADRLLPLVFQEDLRGEDGEDGDAPAGGR